MSIDKSAIKTVLRAHREHAHAACSASGEYVDGTEIEMGNSPWFSNPDNEGVSIADLNGDGLADLLQIRFNSVDIWFNRGDNTFTERHIIENTPAVNSGFKRWGH